MYTKLSDLRENFVCFCNEIGNFIIFRQNFSASVFNLHYIVTYLNSRMFFVKFFLELVFSKSLFSNLTSVKQFTEIVVSFKIVYKNFKILLCKIVSQPYFWISNEKNYRNQMCVCFFNSPNLRRKRKMNFMWKKYPEFFESMYSPSYVMYVSM